ncbi:Anthranilate synthase alpha subunit 1, chloroplastic [Capsicum baccatum]|uniref:anthranilate synthase n=2 Tax=Capsicum TaxID=4071 RepID=A0A1U8FU77_CAPAN|nr:anthranilate synthase alpha subunit 2, chloroplastic isoform X2 [Capsicum annuum]KAF3660114.1 Anthranilate synthase alpha subunit 1, chloroplastic [Capsicum annuum]KAF3674585.1 Anthranilate synthase alpha subunit 1, chloroplastic [Capsicum annuum]PHT55293.1 Anthranilate synthase alpha subunit 1, chloroplastic [Capsicum baccatum]PHT61422.1 Anthranilate synthase alpha subunit 1, chloroplastic [Capsicum annuum]
MKTLAISHHLPVHSGHRSNIFSGHQAAVCSSATSLSFSNSSRVSAAARFRILKCSAIVSPPSLVDDSVKFKEAAKHGNLIPLYRSIFSDHLTPVLAYRCLVKEDDREAPSFLFESVEPGLKVSNVGRYSVIGAQPTMEIVAKENMVTIMDHLEGSRTEEFVEDPMIIPRKIMEKWKPQCIDELPEAFCGGWVGYFSYDTVRYVEKKKLPFSNAPMDDRNLPDLHLGLYDDVIVFDHVKKTAFVIHWVRLDRFASAEEAYNDGTTRLEALVSRVHDIVPPKLASGSIKLHTSHFSTSLKKSTMTSEDYQKAVLKAKEHILAGDIFQIVLSQRFERRTFADPFEVYRALRIVNPSPYMTYLQARGCILVASSPEILTRVKKKTVTNRPLAGTIRRGKTPEEDYMLENQLLHDEKQCAEHIMLVDLGRNDVGKVSKPGSVKVEKLMNIERYSHVMHISSTVTGELLDHLTSWDALRAALPVGTVSGAPKVKAMELIDQLEVTRRGPYSGGFGGISFIGEMDIALALRTIVFPTGMRYDTMYSYKDADKRRDWVAHLQSGAGIVADSDPADEQRECENKAAALVRAIDLAESSFVDK